MYADSLGFLAPALEFRFADKNLAVDMLHITVSPPSVTAEKRMLLWVSAARWFLLLQYRRLKIVTSAQELQAPVAASRHVTKILLGLQHPPVDASIKRLAQRGVRVTTIAYEGENVYGSGFAHPEKGLTPRGEAFLWDLERAGIIFDFSHASHRTARDILEYRHKHGMQLKVMASHTGCFEVYAHTRNLPIDVLKGIAETGGYVGIYMLTFGLDPVDDSIDAFCGHLDYVLKHVDHAHVGIGSDGVYAKMTAEQREAQYRRMAKGHDIVLFKSRNPMEPVPYIAPNKMSLIEEYLIKRGYPKKVVSGLVGENFYRFLIAML